MTVAASCGNISLTVRDRHPGDVRHGASQVDAAGCRRRIATAARQSRHESGLRHLALMACPGDVILLLLRMALTDSGAKPVVEYASHRNVAMRHNTGMLNVGTPMWHKRLRGIGRLACLTLLTWFFGSWAAFPQLALGGDFWRIAPTSAVGIGNVTLHR